MIKQLVLKSSISKARDTYGYNRITLTDTVTGKKYACVGGGYDMVGVVFGEWLQDNYQTMLLSIADKAACRYDKKLGGFRALYNIGEQTSLLYGMTKNLIDGDLLSISLDGACGLECMLTIAQAIGLSVQRQTDSKGHLIGFLSNLV